LKHLFIYLASVSLAIASIGDISSFKADFIQSVTDDKEKVLTYNGSVLAAKPQNALWRYLSPVTKDVYINANRVTIIEPNIEQVIIKRIESNFDFFNMIKNAKQIGENTFIAKYNSSKFTIITKDKLIYSISYQDEFENSVKIEFQNQIQNTEIAPELFNPNIPINFDIVRD